MVRLHTTALAHWSIKFFNGFPKATKVIRCVESILTLSKYAFFSNWNKISKATFLSFFVILPMDEFVAAASGVVTIVLMKKLCWINQTLIVN